MTDIIFQALLSEATDQVARMIKRGKSLDESVSKVSKSMELTVEEATELSERAKKLPHKADPIPGPFIEEKKPLTIAALPESIYFNSLEEMEQATGVLMSKGVAWASKGNDVSGNFIQFEGVDQLNSAHSALKRRWDFVDSSPRKVAVMEFDNLSDYEKVLEFVTKQGLMIEFDGNDELNLDEDINILENQIREQTRAAAKATKQGLVPEAVSSLPSRSYRARGKEERLDLKTVDIYEGWKSRFARIRRRWRK
jgi:hypothetical protein